MKDIGLTQQKAEALLIELRDEAWRLHEQVNHYCKENKINPHLTDEWLNQKHKDILKIWRREATIVQSGVIPWCNEPLLGIVPYTPDQVWARRVTTGEEKQRAIELRIKSSSGTTTAAFFDPATVQQVIAQLQAELDRWDADR